MSDVLIRLEGKRLELRRDLKWWETETGRPLRHATDEEIILASYMLEHLSDVQDMEEEVDVFSQLESVTDWVGDDDEDPELHGVFSDDY
jgi:hypothetical protein